MDGATIAALDLTGKVALVTGGSRGIGRAAAWALARAGATVVVGDVRGDEAEQVVAELRAASLEASACQVDVAAPSSVRRYVHTTVERHGGVDALVNSAGIQRYGTVVDTDPASWNEVIRVNLTGVYLTAQHAIPQMRRRGGGAIVNVASVQAFASQKGVAAYTASKGGVLALTRAMALDHARDGIRVNAVCPASVDTPMLRWAADRFRGDRTVEEMVAEWGAMHPIGRIAQPEEIADLILFLVSPKAAYITGGDYKIDGGMLSALGAAIPE